MARRNYVPEWCGKRVRADYETFRTAFEQYQAAIEDAFRTQYEVSKALPFTCWGDGGFHPANAVDVDMITIPIDHTSRPAVERAAEAWRTMKAAQASAFADNPAAIGVAVNVDQLSAVIEAMGRGNMLLETAADTYRAAQTEEICVSAGAELSAWGTEYVKASALEGTLVRAIQSAMKTTDAACAEFTIVDPMTPKEIRKKAGSATTTKSQGAALVLPRTFNVGKKPKKLPVTIKSPGSGYGTVSLTRGPKGIVATGGQVTKGSFGLLLTIPSKSKEGRATLTFALAGGPTVKGTITFT